MYLAPSGEYEPWDYRDFDIEAMNRTLKDDIESVQAGYEGWFDFQDMIVGGD